jgi:hypothetical protein
MTQQDAWDELFDQAAADLDRFSQEDWQRVFATFAAMSDDERRQLQRETDAWVEGYRAGASRHLARHSKSAISDAHRGTVRAFL